MGLPRQEYWSRLPFPTTGDLLDPGIKPGSPVLASAPLGKTMSILQIRKTEGQASSLQELRDWAAGLSVLKPWRVYVLGCFSRVRLFATPWTAARQGPMSTGILQARILERVAIPSSRGSSQPRDWTQISCIAGGFFTHWATWVAQNQDDPRQIQRVGHPIMIPGPTLHRPVFKLKSDQLKPPWDFILAFWSLQPI